MRIKSRFKDYYDGFRAFGEDPNILYNRETYTPQPKVTWDNGLRKTIPNPLYNEELERKCKVLSTLVNLNHRSYSTQDAVVQLYQLTEQKHVFNRGLVAVCDRLYPWIRITDATEGTGTSTFYWKVEDLKKDFPSFEPNKKDDPFLTLTCVPELSLRMQEYKIPVFFHGFPNYEGVTINPRLKGLNFGRRMPPDQISQELAMWFGNIASKDDTPIKISDKDRIAQHGFDKWSFRKPPAEHK